MRDYVPRIHAAGGELVILGNGTAKQAAWFVEDYGMTTPVLTDPELRSHAIVGARRPWLPDPRTLIRAVAAMRKGFRQTKVLGSARQIGGLFVITADGRMTYRYLSRYAGDHPNPDVAVRELEKAAAG